MGCNNSRVAPKSKAEAAAEANDAEVDESEADQSEADESEEYDSEAEAALPENRLRAATPAAFYAAMKPLEDGGAAPFRFLKGSWIREQAKKIRKAKEDGDEAALKSLAIKFRQEMPEEAFMTVEEVERLSGTIDDMYNRLAAAAVSYCWETREHPDPECNSFLALADALEKCYEEKKRKDGHFNTYKNFPEDIAIFWDYPCLFQHPPGGKRTEEQDRVFKVRAAPPLLLLLCCSHALHLFRHTHARSLASRTSIWSMRTKARPSFGSSTRRRPIARLTYARAGTTHTHPPRLSAGTHHSSGPPRLTADLPRLTANPPPSTA